MTRVTVDVPVLGIRVGDVIEGRTVTYVDHGSTTSSRVDLDGQPTYIPATRPAGWGTSTTRTVVVERETQEVTS